MTEARPFVEGLRFGECPRWHDGRLWYSDFYSGTVSSADCEGDVRVEVEVPGEPAGLGWLPDGRLLAVSRKPRSVLRREDDGRLVQHADLSQFATFHANDMVVDREGRAYVGNFGFDLDRFVEERGAGALRDDRLERASLTRVDPDGSVSEAASGLSFPNGAVITPDGRTLIVAETFGRVLTAFDIDDRGALGGRRQWAALRRCAPDGICLDEDGRVWVANAAGNECLLVAEGGETVDRVTTSQNCYACMLGGPDRRTLYLMTAPTSTESDARRSRLGRIERAEVRVGGAGLP